MVFPGSSPITSPCFFTSTPEVRVLPPPALPGFFGTSDPLRFPPRSLPFSSVGIVISNGGGPPPITQTTFLTCRAHYLGGSNRCLSVSFPARAAFPNLSGAGIRDFTFEACSSFTRVAACQIAHRPRAGFVTRLRSAELPSRTACQLPRSYRQLHGWVLSPVGDLRCWDALRYAG